MRQVHQYNPSETLSSHLILDGITLANLEVLENSRDKTAAGTLLQHLNHCVTPFGKREFKRWLCNPLRVRAAPAAPQARPWRCGTGPPPAREGDGVGRVGARKNVCGRRFRVPSVNYDCFCGKWL